MGLVKECIIYADLLSGKGPGHSTQRIAEAQQNCITISLHFHSLVLVQLSPQHLTIYNHGR